MMKTHHNHRLRRPFRNALDRANSVSSRPAISSSPLSPRQRFPVLPVLDFEKVQSEGGEEDVGRLEDEWDFAGSNEA
jgi:hypothetical protein